MAEFYPSLKGRLGNRSSFTTGSKTVTTAGVAEQLPDIAVPEGREALITAKDSNGGRVYIGGTKAEAEAHTLSLGADDIFGEYLTNLNCLWIDVDTGGEGIDYEVPE